MWHAILDVIGMALFVGCYAFALGAEPLPADDDDAPPDRGQLLRNL
ncbi:MAG TPA: hypothetical protein VGB82_08325 [Alphaproteobacteria bacterium]